MSPSVVRDQVSISVEGIKNFTEGVKTVIEALREAPSLEAQRVALLTKSSDPESNLSMLSGDCVKPALSFDAKFPTNSADPRVQPILLGVSNILLAYNALCVDQGGMLASNDRQPEVAKLFKTLLESCEAFVAKFGDKDLRDLEPPSSGVRRGALARVWRGLQQAKDFVFGLSRLGAASLFNPDSIIKTAKIPRLSFCGTYGVYSTDGQAGIRDVPFTDTSGRYAEVADALHNRYVQLLVKYNESIRDSSKKAVAAGPSWSGIGAAYRAGKEFRRELTEAVAAMDKLVRSLNGASGNRPTKEEAARVNERTVETVQDMLAIPYQDGSTALLREYVANLQAFTRTVTGK